MCVCASLSLSLHFGDVISLIDDDDDDETREEFETWTSFLTGAHPDPLTRAHAAPHVHVLVDGKDVLVGCHHGNQPVNPRSTWFLSPTELNVHRVPDADFVSCEFDDVCVPFLAGGSCTPTPPTPPTHISQLSHFAVHHGNRG